MNAQHLQHDRPLLKSARQTAAWIDLARVPTEHGCTWSESAEITKSDPPTYTPWALYSGPFGIVLFLFELCNATGEKTYLEQALAGLDEVRHTLPLGTCEDTNLDLYHGLPSAVYVYELAYQIAGRSTDHETAAQCVAEIRRHENIFRALGKSWGRGTEIVGGRGGTGLALLWWYRHTHDEDALDLAIQAGRVILQRAKPHEAGGFYWDMGDTLPDLPGFAHGSAGVGCFLAELYVHTREQAFLDAAVGAARRLQRIAIGDETSCMVPAMLLEDDKRVPMRFANWCHGAVGIWRLPYQLGKVTDDQEWHDWVHQLARGVMTCGIPEQRKGFLPSSAIVCCGDAGLLQGFLDLHVAYKKTEYLAFALRMHASLMQRAIVDETGMRWNVIDSTADAPSRPPRLAFMFGASGIGTSILHLDGSEQGRRPFVTLPDSPFYDGQPAVMA